MTGIGVDLGVRQGTARQGSAEYESFDRARRDNGLHRRCRVDTLKVQAHSDTPDLRGRQHDAPILGPPEAVDLSEFLGRQLGSRAALEVEHPALVAPRTGRHAPAVVREHWSTNEQVGREPQWEWLAGRKSPDQTLRLATALRQKAGHKGQRALVGEREDRNIVACDGNIRQEGDRCTRLPLRANIEAYRHKRGVNTGIHKVAGRCVPGPGPRELERRGLPALEIGHDELPEPRAVPISQDECPLTRQQLRPRHVLVEHPSRRFEIEAPRCLVCLRSRARARDLTAARRQRSSCRRGSRRRQSSP